ncbi:MAG: long-chain fatty acid--CoA ligase [Micrococcales bacterium]|nr:long-chain fatty acid--CoA ligase [Micrococcales bacterium]
MTTLDDLYPLHDTPPLVAGAVEGREPSVGHLFRKRVAETPDSPALRFAAGEAWETLTWAQTKDRVYRLAAGLVALGIEPEQRVGLSSSTRVEWALADWAINLAGAATTTVYPTTRADDVAFILGDSDSRVVFAEDDAQIDKLRSQRDALPDVGKVVTFDGTPDGDWVIGLDELDRLGAERLAEDAGVVDARIDQLTPEHLCTLVYTSGTTGRPKGVRLTHDAWTYEAAANKAIDQIQFEDVQFLWLPLAHVFGKLMMTIPLEIGCETVVDGRIDKIAENLAVTRPTFMCGAPRVYEKVYQGVRMAMQKEGGVKYRLFRWACDTGLKVSNLADEGKRPGALLARQHALADKLVLTKIRERFGGQIRFFVSGSAPLNDDVQAWFNGIGTPLIEGYGLTESSAGSTVGRLQYHRNGTVGPAYPGTDFKIDHDGEILIKGPGVMEGYHNNPEATAEAFTDDGYLRTGDIGQIEDGGFIRITDRKKDLFKTSGGKYIAPSAIESEFKGICPFVSQMLVHGPGRNYATALVTLDPVSIVPWAAEHGLEGKSYEEIAASEQAREMVQHYIDKLNSQLNRWETIKKFTILDHDLTVEDGELTPSMKMRRAIVSDRYREHLDGMY